MRSFALVVSVCSRSLPYYRADHPSLIDMGPVPAGMGDRERLRGLTEQYGTVTVRGITRAGERIARARDAAIQCWQLR
jgi:hypothetical protein